MQSVTVIAVGGLKEKYFRDAVDEYKKRLGGASRVSEIEIKEEKLQSAPSELQIRSALDFEAERIIASIPKRSFVISMCIEGKLLSSEELAAVIDRAATDGNPSVTFIIGSSHGLSERVKNISDLRLSMSRMTFPHKLARVMLFEAIYRSAEINAGGKYHK
ncbi:MAG: 23S rRNA (pseudouridine(1915)-N(3))-methyltransferase RlmH [Clostridiales bacterium]|nr:23S rRNA (pseudouridine(1915)-N(3))-methyltransferase RlmH [Clostridiales bacterium]